jgi:hypothetical protein
MPIDKPTLDAIARAYVVGMTSIRGRRVHRLLMREWAHYDHVLRASMEDGVVVLFALGEDGGAAVCRTDGRGTVVAIESWARLNGSRVSTSFDLTKDSLPVQGWMVSHPGFACVGGALMIQAADLPPAEHDRVTDLLRRLGQ